jgi:hypothetical protein
VRRWKGQGTQRRCGREGSVGVQGCGRVWPGVSQTERSGWRVTGCRVRVVHDGAVVGLGGRFWLRKAAGAKAEAGRAKPTNTHTSHPTSNTPTKYPCPYVAHPCHLIHTTTHSLAPPPRTSRAPDYRAPKHAPGASCALAQHILA